MKGFSGFVLAFLLCLYGKCRASAIERDKTCVKIHACKHVHDAHVPRMRHAVPLKSHEAPAQDESICRLWSQLKRVTVVTLHSFLHLGSLKFDGSQLVFTLRIS